MKNLLLCLLLCLLTVACKTTPPTEKVIVPPAWYSTTVTLEADTVADNAVVDTLLSQLDTLSAPTKAVIRREVKKALATRPRFTKPILLDTLGMTLELRQDGDSLKLELVRDAYEIQVPVPEPPAPKWYEKLPIDKWWFWLPVCVMGLWLFFLVRLIIGFFSK